MTEELPFCECGCGKRVAKPENRYIRGHHRGMLGKYQSQKAKDKISKANTGVMSEIMNNFYINNPKVLDEMSKSATKRWSDPNERKRRSEYMLKEKDPLPDGLEFNKNCKIVTNKNCADYLGCYIAERLLSKIFKNVKVMPRGNHGYDIICDNGYKIDIKSAATGYKNYWAFNIKKNKIADYFLCIAFESRKDLTPIHLWLIPEKDINHLTNAVIQKSTIQKWSKYEQPIDKVILCCNEMKKESK